MTDLTDIEFDHDAPSVKKRVLNQGVSHTQDGVVFSAGYVPLRYANPDDARKKVKPARPVLPKRKKKRAAVGDYSSARDLANQKLKGFKTDEKPDAVKEALSEDASAKKAEEFVE